MPCTTKRVLRSINMLTCYFLSIEPARVLSSSSPRMHSLFLRRQRDRLLDRLVHRLGGMDGRNRTQNFAGLFFVGSRQAHDYRELQIHLIESGHQSARDVVAAGDAAENVEQDRLDTGVLQNDGE